MYTSSTYGCTQSALTLRLVSARHFIEDHTGRLTKSSSKMHLQYTTQLLMWLGSSQATDLEVNMNAVERMVEYTSQPTEGSSQASAWPPPRDWPHAGGIVIDNLQVLHLQLFSVPKCLFYITNVIPTLEI